MKTMVDLSGLLMQICDTFRQWDGDDDAVSCPHPQSAAGHHESCDSHK